MPALWVGTCWSRQMTELGGQACCTYSGIKGPLHPPTHFQYSKLEKLLGLQGLSGFTGQERIPAQAGNGLKDIEGPSQPSHSMGYKGKGERRGRRA